MEEPIGMTVEVDRSFIATSIFRRFASFSEGVEVSVDVAMTKGGGKDETGKNRKLRTLNELLDRVARYEDVRDQNSGVVVRYIHDPKHETSGHTLSARANPAVGSTTFCALIYKEERYDFKTRKGWSAVAPSFGIPFGSRVLTVEIRLPDAMALPNQYRDALTWPHDRSPLLAEQFAHIVRQQMPDNVFYPIRHLLPDNMCKLLGQKWRAIKWPIQSVPILVWQSHCIGEANLNGQHTRPKWNAKGWRYR